MTMRRMRWMRAHALRVIVRARAAPPSLDAIAEGYVRAALRLAQHDPDLVEAWRGPESLAPGPRGPVDQHRRRHRRPSMTPSISRRHVSVAENRRGSISDPQLRALRFAAGRLLGRSASIDEQAREEFGIAVAADIEAARRTMRSEIDQSSCPGGRARRTRSRTLTRTDHRSRTRKRGDASAARRACRDAARRRLIYCRGRRRQRSAFHKRMPWDALRRHTPAGIGTQIEINDEGPLDVSRALRLACHEGYPGHHVQHLLIDQIVRVAAMAGAAADARLRAALAVPRRRGGSRVGPRVWPANAAMLYRDRLRRGLAASRSQTPGAHQDLHYGSCCRSSPRWRAAVSR